MCVPGHDLGRGSEAALPAEINGHRSGFPQNVRAVARSSAGPADATSCDIFMMRVTVTTRGTKDKPGQYLTRA